jgi:DNA polymerase III delta prime subunit
MLLKKYKPTKIADFQFPPNLESTLNSFLSNNCIHLLIYGASVSGKTTLIHSLLNDYYEIPNYGSNVLYINNIQEQTVQADMKGFCQTKCTIPNKKKFIVIDDLDTIQEQHQQIFCNFIDKYKTKIHFICSCNNLQKVLDCIHSRLFVAHLPIINSFILRNILDKIVLNEQILMENDKVKEKVIKASNNSVNILINMLDKYRLYGLEITEDVVDKLCSNIPNYVFDEYTSFVKEKNINEAVRVIIRLFHQGYSVLDILDCYYVFIKETNELSDTQKYKFIPHICNYINHFYIMYDDCIELAFFTNKLIDNV